MTTPLIQVECLRLQLEGNAILSDVDLSISEGEYISIMGPNGAGKSSLVKCLAGIERRWQGRLLLDGRPITAYGGKRLARLISYVPQADGRAMPFSVHEFVMMGRYPHFSPFSSPTRDDEQAVEEALELTGMESFRERRVDTLSGGERQSVYLAAALAQGGKIMLLDEPTTFLDYHHQIAVMRIIRGINRDHGTTVIAVEHDINTAVQWSHQIVALKEGRTVFHGPPSAFLRPNVLSNVFDAQFRLVPKPPDPLPLVAPRGD